MPVSVIVFKETMPLSQNAIIKRWQEFTLAHLNNFVNDYEQLVDEQMHNVSRRFLKIESLYVVKEDSKIDWKDGVNCDFFQEDTQIRKELMDRYDVSR